MQIATLTDLCGYFDAETPSQLPTRVALGTKARIVLSVQTADYIWHHGQHASNWNDLGRIIGLEFRASVPNTQTVLDYTLVMPVEDKRLETVLDWLEEQVFMLRQEVG